MLLTTQIAFLVSNPKLGHWAGGTQTEKDGEIQDNVQKPEEIKRDGGRITHGMLAFQGRH
jgi:hypothetical protein